MTSLNYLPTYSKYTVSQKNCATFFTAYNFRNIEQIFAKLGTNHVLFMLNLFFWINLGK